MHFLIFITNTTIMKLFISLALIIILILFLPLKLKSKLIYNLFINKGIISVYFYSIRLFVSKWKLIPFKFIVQRKNKKDISIYFYNLKKQTNDFGEIFFSQLIKKIKLRSFKSFLNFGISEKAYLTSIFVGFFKFLLGSFNVFLVNKKGINSIYSQIFADFKKNNSIFCVSLSLEINLFIIFYCAVTSLFIKFCKR